ncbi:three-Cys-motif partner protein TcmP [soil metagenome]
MAHSFGGKWTQEKLDKVGHYLQTYSTALKNQKFKLIYVDAFAGTGYVNLQDKSENQPFLIEFEETDVRDFVSGSAKNALEINPPFDEYIFIEKDEKRFSELSNLKKYFPNIADRIIPVSADANEYLQNFCRGDWRYKRAIVFLDPYGMQVKWETIQAIAKTQAIDLWILFPLGVAVNRLLKKDGNISELIKKRLDEMFGTENWFEEFFKEKEIRGLFDTQTILEKTANLDSIADYFNKRLASVFAGVAKNPLKLYNTKNNPLYLLCFAVGNPNPKAQGLALKFANHILQMR